MRTREYLTKIEHGRNWLANLRCSQRSRFAAWATIFCLTWLAIIYLPHDPLRPAIDASCQAALSYFAKTAAQFGQQAILTYGPLAYLVPEVYDGALFSRRLIVELIVKLFMAGVLVSIARPLGLLRRTAFFVAIWVLAPRFGNSYPEVLLYFCIAASAVILERGDGRSVLFLTAALSFLAFVSLIKLPLFAYALGTIIVLTSSLAMKGKWKRAAVLLPGFAMAIAIGWRAAAQNFANFPHWIVTSIEIASGYQQSTALDAQTGVLPLALVTLTVAALLIGFEVQRLCEKSVSWPSLLPIAAGYWLSFKHGLIRADDHVNLFFGFALLCFIAFPAFTQRPISAAATARVLSGLGAVLCVGGIVLQNPAYLRRAPAHTLENFSTTARTLLSVKGYESKMREQLLEQKQRFDCPDIRSKVGDATVDVFGQYLGIAFLNDLNYHPRPVFQSYCAITPFLMRLNDEFYRSKDAPEYIISLFDTIDDRLAAQDDADALRTLLLDYDPVLKENEWLLWRKRILPRSGRAEMKLLDTREATMGEEIPLSETNVWCRIDLKETALGKLREAVYKLPPVLIMVTDAEGGRTLHRLLPSAAREGFIVDPYLINQQDLIGFRTESLPPPKRVVSIQLLNSAATSYFAPRFSVRFYSDTDLGSK